VFVIAKKRDLHWIADLFIISVNRNFLIYIIVRKSKNKTIV